MVTINRMGEMQMNAISAIPKSRNRLIKCLYMNHHLWMLPSIVFDLLVVLTCSFFGSIRQHTWSFRHLFWHLHECQVSRVILSIVHSLFRKIPSLSGISLMFNIGISIIFIDKSEDCRNYLSVKMFL